MEQKWGRMIILSLVLHLALLITVLFVPEHVTVRKIRHPVYEVDLVEMPSQKRHHKKSGGKAVSHKALSAPAKALPTKRIGKPAIKEKTVPIAKRTVAVKAKKIAPPEVSSTKLLDEALAKIEPKVSAENKEAVDQSISRINARPPNNAGARPFGSRAGDGMIMAIYKADIMDWVCNNWSYPVALLGPDSGPNLATVVVLKVEKNGAILRTTMTQGSGNAKFDQSVLKAIKRSDPLPPFPEGYRKTHEEIEINFNLSELKNR